MRVLTAPPPPEANPDFFSSPEWRTVAPMGKLEYVISSKAEGGAGNGALRIDADSIRPWLSPGFVGFGGRGQENILGRGFLYGSA